MSSEVKTREADFMDNKSETESLRLRIREVEDENQELRAQNLLQNRTIVEMRNEIVLMRLQMTEMADTSALLTERVRTLTQNVTQNATRTENEGSGLITTPPLMAPPPPPPPPLPPARIRISPRQVGAGEALTTPLGVSISSPPRHRIKRDARQGFYRSTRSPYRRLDVPEPGPSSGAQYLSSERPNYFVGLRIIPQFQTSFVCSQNHQSSGYSDSASDSSGSDDNPQLFKKLKMKVFDGESSFRKSSSFTRDFELLKNVKNFHHQRVRQTILQNYNLALPNTNSKLFFPLAWDRKNRDNPTLPSTSGNDTRFFHPATSAMTDHGTQAASTAGLRNPTKISNCVQYTFPTIHEGLHHNGSQTASSQATDTGRLRKLKKNIPYSSSNFCSKTSNDVQMFKCPKAGEAENDDDVHLFLSSQKNQSQGVTRCVDTESITSVDEGARGPKSRTVLRGEVSSDIEQDGFQADESSNCMTSTENSLEKISISESNLEKKEDGGKQ